MPLTKEEKRLGRRMIRTAKDVPLTWIDRNDLWESFLETGRAHGFLEAMEDLCIAINNLRVASMN